MTKHIAFLHTSPVHVEPFGKLAREIDPTAVVDHIVDESLLLDAQRLGTADVALIRRVRAALERAAAGGASVAVCTCSTIGGIAESTPTGAHFVVGRIDRAMADRAVSFGRKVLVVAAFESTVGPTVALVESSAAKAGADLELRSVVVAGAWDKFVAGDRSAYVTAIAASVREQLGDAEVVVLAQASMAPAADLLSDLRVPVLASPKLGVESALRSASGGPAV
jgi:hypothetical protein